MRIEKALDWWTPPRVELAGLLVLTLALYLPSVTNNATLDELLIAKSANALRYAPLTDLVTKGAYFAKFEEHSYRPFVTSTYMLDARLFSGRILPAKVHSVCWHALNVILLCLLLRRVRSSQDELLPVFAAIAFAVHPINTEAVLNVGFREDLMALTGILGALLVASHCSVRSSFASCLVALAAALSKEIGIVAVPLLVLARLLLPSWKVSKRFLAGELAGLSLVTASFAFLRFVAMVGPTYHPEFPGFSRVNALLNLPVLFLHYVGELIWPWPLIFYFNHVGRFNWESPSPVRMGGGVLLLLGAAAAAWHWRRKQPAAVLGILVVVLPLLPALNLFPQNLWVGQRYVYCSCAGYAIVVAQLFSQWLFRTPEGTLRRVVTRLACAITIWAAVVTFGQQANWRTNTRLWRHTLAKDPTHCLAHWNLTQIYRWKRDCTAVMRQADRGLAYCPGWTGRTYLWNSIPFMMLAKKGECLKLLGRAEEATQLFKAAPALRW